MEFQLLHCCVPSKIFQRHIVDPFVFYPTSIDYAGSSTSAVASSSANPTDPAPKNSSQNCESDSATSRSIGMYRVLYWIFSQRGEKQPSVIKL